MHDDDMPDDQLPDPWALPSYHPLNPVGWMDRWMTKQAKRTVEDQKVYVMNPRRLRTLFWWDIATFVLVLGGLVAFQLLPDDHWLGLLIIPLVGFTLGKALMWRIHHARAYRNGWLDGRRQMVASMSEAMNRGMSIEDWIHAEIERDLQVMKRW